MTTFRLAAKGATWMLGAQLVIGVGQFLYSAVTARVFTPTEFGGFAAALSLQALLVLLTTTGLPSIILREKNLTLTDVGVVRVYALVGGTLAAIVFWLIVPYWLTMLNARNGIDYVPLLTVALILGPTASIEASMLRREARSAADAMTFILAFIIPAAAAVVAALTLRQAWALALVTVLNPITLGISSAFVRRVRLTEVGPRRHQDFLRFARTVSLQNVVFLLIGQFPSWAISGVLGAASLGQYSRASTLAGMPGASLSTALNRATQPHWRKLSDASTIANAIRDTAVLTSGLAFPFFAFLAAVGPDLSELWLGPGWQEAGDLMPWLAVAFGLQVPFGVLASSLEMRSQFRPVRYSQVGLAAGLVVGMSVFVLTRDVRVAAMGLAFSQAIGLLALLTAMAASSHLSAWSLIRPVGLAGLWALGVGLVGVLGVETAHRFSWAIFGVPELAAVITGGGFALLGWVGTFRWQPASSVLTSRNVPLPKVLSRRCVGTAP